MEKLMSDALILIVEDDSLTALDIRNTLERIGYRVPDPVISGAEAVSKATELKPDLIIADISLRGELNGIDAVRQIQKTIDVPVIYLTAYSSPEMFRRALGTNLFGYLVKPVSMDDLHTTIETALQRGGLERKLRESEERYRTLFEESPEPIIIFNRVGFALNINPAYEQFTGYSREETIGLNFTKLPVLLQQHMPEYLEIYRNMMKGNKLHRMEIPVLHKNGKQLYVEIFISSLVKEQKLTAFQIIARDITEQKHAIMELKASKNELKEANELLEQRVRERTKKLLNEIEERKKIELKLREGEEVARALIDSPSEPVFLASTDGTVIDLNFELEKRLGLAKNEIIGRSMFDFISKRTAARYREKIQAVVVSEKAARFENQLGGNWYDTIMYPVPDHRGVVTKLAIFSHDITETRRLQKDIMEISELERKRIGQELHDGLGQKLTGIAFLAEALKRTMREKDYPEVSDVEEITANIAESIDQARKISSGLWTTRLESYDAARALQELADDTENLFGITCKLDSHISIPLFNSTVVINLYFIARESINNAIRHGKARRIDIRLSDDRDCIYLEIKDNGKGAAAAFQDGAGIGLRIMQYRAGIIGGACSFENGGHGFIVRVTIRKEFIDMYL
jgi:PAS domain S-box-containing protein